MFFRILARVPAYRSSPSPAGSRRHPEHWLHISGVLLLYSVRAHLSLASLLTSLPTLGRHDLEGKPDYSFQGLTFSCVPSSGQICILHLVPQKLILTCSISCSLLSLNTKSLPTPFLFQINRWWLNEADSFSNQNVVLSIDFQITC